MFELNQLYNVDCLDAMKKIPDKSFELAIVDPPYGIERLKQATCSLSKYGDARKANNNVPTNEYFAELKRVSKNQTIWGGNYFSLPPNRCFIFWYKRNPMHTYSDGEYAWTSFNRPAVCIDYAYFGATGAEKNRIHPTQKPVGLYKQCLQRFGKKGDKILDTRVGSASSLIACYDLGFKYLGFELDEDFYKKAQKRLEDHKAQIRFF